MALIGKTVELTDDLLQCLLKQAPRRKARILVFGFAAWALFVAVAQLLWGLANPEERLPANSVSRPVAAAIMAGVAVALWWAGRRLPVFRDPRVAEEISGGVAEQIDLDVVAYAEMWNSGDDCEPSVLICDTGDGRVLALEAGIWMTLPLQAGTWPDGKQCPNHVTVIRSPQTGFVLRIQFSGERVLPVTLIDRAFAFDRIGPSVLFEGSLATLERDLERVFGMPTTAPPESS